MMRAAPRARRPFTGWHMTIILVAFFVVVMSVNIFMAVSAISTFGGTVVDNSYVASQKFNGWLDAARRQQQMGWRRAIALDDARHVRVTLTDQAGQPVSVGIITGRAIHPLGRAPEVKLTFQSVGHGVYRAQQALPAGRWQVRVTLAGHGETQHFQKEVD